MKIAGFETMSFDIGFADSNIQSYAINDSNVTLLLERWNAEIIKMIFFNFVMIYGTDNVEISEFQEVFDSALLDQSIDKLYEKKPKEHNLRVFRFYDSDDEIALEIVCEDLKIERDVL